MTIDSLKLPDWATKVLVWVAVTCVITLISGLGLLIQISNQISRNDERLKSIEQHNNYINTTMIDHEGRIRWLEAQHEKRK